MENTDNIYNIDVIKIQPTGFECNCFLIKINNDGVLIDCGINIQTIQKVLDDNNITLKYIILTHGHYDHISSLPILEEKYPDVKVIIHQKDSACLKKDNKDNLAKSLFDIDFEGCYYTDIIIDDKQMDILGKNFSFYNTPGHTPGSMLICVENYMFVGDVVFNLSVGRFDFPNGSGEEMKKSIKFIKENFKDDYMIFTGHGDATILSFEKQNNPYFLSDKYFSPYFY